MSGHIIVFGNEKGGSGKTTISVHIAIYMLINGYSVASIDLDARQRSFSRYMENRAGWKSMHGLSVPMPDHHIYDESNINNPNEIKKLISELSRNYDLVIVDTPGAINPSNCAAHAMANTIVTPINDSFVDLDLLGQIKNNDYSQITPGVYSQMVWDQKLERARSCGSSLDWVVIRNRLSNLETRNRQNVEKVLLSLSKRFGFRICSACSERVVFREMFPRGATLMDVNSQNCRTTLSHIAARQELRNLVHDLRLLMHQNQPVA